MTAPPARGPQAARNTRRGAKLSHHGVLGALTLGRLSGVGGGSSLYRVWVIGSPVAEPDLGPTEIRPQLGGQSSHSDGAPSFRPRIRMRSRFRHRGTVEKGNIVQVMANVVARFKLRERRVGHRRPRSTSYKSVAVKHTTPLRATRREIDQQC